jgi:uncharacterized membrane protein YvlD (DUF360 family)
VVVATIAVLVAAAIAPGVTVPNFGDALLAAALIAILNALFRLPEGLAFTTMFAALPGALVAAPFSLIVLAALTTQIGSLQTASVAIAVVTAYLAVSGSGALMALANRARGRADPSMKPARSR